MGSEEVVAFLNYLANKESVSASTQNQALSALAFLYKHIINIDLGELPNFQYAKKPKRLPTVLTQKEVKAVFKYLVEPHKTIVGLMYGSGLRLNECLKLRVLDVDIERKEIIVRRGKGNKDRRSILPVTMIPGLELAIANTEKNHLIDKINGINHVYIRMLLAENTRMQVNN